jgi:hypothetical protein
MKIIHILPTDKPSRLLVRNDKPFVLMLKEHSPFATNKTHTNQNIYITNDEEIKEGDWILLPSNEIYKMSNTDMIYYLESESKSTKKIILTDNKDLIKDGVQAIDDEFLEWFVKNPSCEFVKIVDDVECLPMPNIHINRHIYKIIIPKEESKQETLEEYLQICKDCGSKEVARCKWVNVNTEEIYSADSGTNLEWCFNCKSETNIINKEDYETKIQ